jgi:hypothetical protein
MLEIVLGGCDIPLIGVVNFLVATIIASHNGNALGALLLLLLSVIGTFLNAFGGGLRWCCSAATSGYFHVARD